MELLWKAVAGLVLLLLVQETATGEAPEIALQDVGSTYVTLWINSPSRGNYGRRVDKYMIKVTSRGADIVERFARRHRGNEPTTVTLGELSPMTTYTFRVSPVYSDRSEGPASEIYVKTKAEGSDMNGGYGDDREMSSAGAALATCTVTSVVIGLHLIVSWATSF